MRPSAARAARAASSSRRTRLHLPSAAWQCSATASLLDFAGVNVSLLPLRVKSEQFELGTHGSPVQVSSMTCLLKPVSRLCVGMCDSSVVHAT